MLYASYWYCLRSASVRQMYLSPLVFSENSMADIDQLVDLSAVIPATAQAVVLEIQLNAISVPVGMEQILTVFGRRAGMPFLLIPRAGVV